MKAFLLSALVLIGLKLFAQPLRSTVAQSSANSSTIQVAILLDVSGSMEGLIEQAKAQLWSMVETLGKASCNGQKPTIQIALYEYGRPDNGITNNYVKTISTFTSDLDSLSAKMFALHTGGGDEFCGAVMVQSLKELAWDTKASNYKVVFIAGNESFRQGSISWTEACTLAKEKGVIINTIYCGPKQTGVTEFWNLAGECGNGTYSNINQNQKDENISAPQDSMIYVLNDKLNGSYVSYVSAGASRMQLMRKVDAENKGMSSSIMAKRASVKMKTSTYNNSSWDLVDAAKADSTVLTKLDKQYLPDSLRQKSTVEIKQYVTEKGNERSAIQQQLAILISEREKYIANVRKEKSQNNYTENLENAIQQTIKSQAVKYNIQFED